MGLWGAPMTTISDPQTPGQPCLFMTAGKGKKVVTADFSEPLEHLYVSAYLWSFWGTCGFAVGPSLASERHMY